MRGGVRAVSGFTLIEVLLAVAILAVIMTVIYGSFWTAQKNVEQAEAVRDDTDMARTLLAKITDDLTNAYVNRNMIATSTTTNKPVNLTIFYSSKEEVGDGEEKVRHDSLALTTLSNFPRPGSKETELVEVGYFFREKPDGSGYTLFRREKRDIGPDSPPLEGGVAYEITDRVDELRFRYYTGISWRDDWDTRTMGALPQLVEVALTLDSGKFYVTQVDVSR